MGRGLGPRAISKEQRGGDGWFREGIILLPATLGRFENVRGWGRVTGRSDIAGRPPSTVSRSRAFDKCWAERRVRMFSLTGVCLLFCHLAATLGMGQTLFVGIKEPSIITEVE